MSSDRPSQKEIESLCSGVGPEDGIDPRYLYQHPSARTPGRKLLQLCGQVSRALAALLPCCGNELLRELEVVSVTPAGGAGRLLVTLRPGAGIPSPGLDEIEAHLARARGMLRSEVAAAVHRRKAPELVLRVIRRSP